MIPFINILDLFRMKYYWVYLKTFQNVHMKGINDDGVEESEWQVDEKDDLKVILHSYFYSTVGQMV